MDESTNDGIVNVGDSNDGGAAMNPATGTEPAAQSTDADGVVPMLDEALSHERGE